MNAETNCSHGEDLARNLTLDTAEETPPPGEGAPDKRQLCLTGEQPEPFTENCNPVLENACQDLSLRDIDKTSHLTLPVG